MEDFPGLLARDFGFRPQGKSAPMKSSSSSALGSGSGSSSARPNNHPVASFDDVFGGPPNRPVKNQPPSFDSIFDDPNPNPNPKPKYSSMPVYDKPVYDDDIFEGAPGIKSSAAAAKVEYEDVFASISKGGRAEKGGELDDLLRNLGSSGSKREAKRSDGLGGFEELIPGFGGSSPSSRR